MLQTLSALIAVALLATFLGPCFAGSDAEDAAKMQRQIRMDTAPNCTLTTVDDDPENNDPLIKMYIANNTQCNDYEDEVWGSCNCPKPYRMCLIESDTTYYCQRNVDDLNEWYAEGLVLGGAPGVVVAVKEDDGGD